MNSKPKSIDMGSLIQKVTKRARELLKKKSKPQTKGKSANGTSRYSKSKRQKLLIGGVSVNIEDSRDAINNILSSKTDVNKEGKAHLVHLLKLQTIKKINEIYKELLGKMGNVEPEQLTENQKTQETDIKIILDDIEAKLKVDNVKENSKNEEFIPDINNTYEYDIFVDNFEIYKRFNLDKDIIALNIFKLFKQLLDVEDKHVLDPGLFMGGKINGGGIDTDLSGKQTYSAKYMYLQNRVDEYTKLLTDVRTNFVALHIMEPLKKKRRDDSLVDDTIEDFLDNFEEYSSISPEMRSKLNSFIQTVKIGGNIKEIIQEPLMGVGKKKVLWSNDTGFYIYFVNKNPILLKINDFFNEEVRKETSANKLGFIRKHIDEINTKIILLIESYKSINKTEIVKIQGEITKIVGIIKKLYIEIAISKGNDENGFIPPRAIAVEASTAMGNSSTRTAHQLALGQDPFSNGGGNPAKYKSTGQVVHIMFQNKKYKRVIYVKEKRNTKYCKMNNEYILLSKLKVIE